MSDCCGLLLLRAKSATGWKSFTSSCCCCRFRLHFILYIPQNLRSDLRKKITAISACSGFLSFFQTDSFRGSSTLRLCDQASWLVNGSCKVEPVCVFACWGGGGWSPVSQSNALLLFIYHKKCSQPLWNKRQSCMQICISHCWMCMKAVCWMESRASHMQITFPHAALWLACLY